MSKRIESPCLECSKMVGCKKMCYKRLEWGVLESSPTDEELNIYGNNIKVKGSELVKGKNLNLDKEVIDLLRDFKQIYEEKVR